MSVDKGSEKIRPSIENIAIADYYLAEPKLNVALQLGGLKPGPIASHILTTYYFLKEKGEVKLTDDEKRWFKAFKIFAEKKLPELAAEQAENIVYELLDTFKQTSQVKILTTSGQDSTLARAIEGELRIKDLPEPPQPGKKK